MRESHLVLGLLVWMQFLGIFSSTVVSDVFNEEVLHKGSKFECRFQIILTSVNEVNLKKSRAFCKPKKTRMVSKYELHGNLYSYIVTFFIRTGKFKKAEIIPKPTTTITTKTTIPILENDCQTGMTRVCGVKKAGSCKPGLEKICPSSGKQDGFDGCGCLPSILVQQSVKAGVSPFGCNGGCVCIKKEETSCEINSTSTAIPTPLPPSVKLPQCYVESLSFALDISGSMSGDSQDIWKSAAASLIEEMAMRQVNISRHYLFTYVDTIEERLVTTNHQTFLHTINTWDTFEGSNELTFAALKHAMEQVATNAFVCIWTDEIGDDTDDSALKSEILKLKADTNSEIFFMVVTKYVSRKVSGTEMTEDENEDENEKDYKDENEDDDRKQERVNVDINSFKSRFGDIGFVMDITNDPSVIPRMINKMLETKIC